MVEHPAHLPAAGFAAGRVEAALRELGMEGDVRLVVRPGEGGGAESFVYRRAGSRVEVVGSDEAGLMYGALDLAEQLRLVGWAGIGERAGKPAVGFRALKFNLPWSAYRWGEVMTQHIETCRTREFWAALIDMLAENRFNVLSLWNLHPFTFMFRPRGFEEACDLSDGELAEYQGLFRFIFRRCRERAIKPYVLFWNIFVSEAFAKAHGLDFLEHGHEYHFGDGDLSELVERYNTQCVTQLIDEYEDLAGIGSAAGDRMQNLSPGERQAWIERVVIGGIKASTRPGIDYVHRAPFTQHPQEVRETIGRAAMPGKVYLEYKFNWSHAHSTPRLCMAHDEGKRAVGEALKVDDGYWNPPPMDYKVVWMARNEDIFLLRWGQPDFIREHIRTNKHDWTAGYFVGSEGYIPAKEYAQKNPVHKYAFERQWLFYMLWGRLMYEPGTGDAVFEGEFERRYGHGCGREMLWGYGAASKAVLQLARLNSATWDYTLYAEGFLVPFRSEGRHDGCAFINIMELIEHRPLDPEVLSIPELVKRGVRPIGEGANRTPHLAMVQHLLGDAHRAADMVPASIRKRMGTIAPHSALDLELADLEAWGHYGAYFAYKLRAAVALETYRQTGDENSHRFAVANANSALAQWRMLAEVTSRTFNRVPYIDRPRQDYRLEFHWADFLPYVEADIELARAARPYAEGSGV